MKSQAAYIFRAAAAMWRQSPALTKRLTPSGANPVWNLADLKTGKPTGAGDTTLIASGGTETFSGFAIGT